MNIEIVNLNAINMDESPQVRVTNNADVISDYAAELKAGVKFPPVVLFGENGSYYLADGFHRVEATKIAGLDSIDADVRPGVRKDALMFALSANTTHGLRRTNADKRNAVRMALAEFPEYSNNRIADELCRVSDDLVAVVRRELEAEAEADLKRKTAKAAGAGSTDKAEKRLGKDGKTYPARKSTGIPAGDWTPPEHVQETAADATTAASVAEIIPLLRDLTARVIPNDQASLVEALREIADEIEADMAGSLATA